MNKLEHDRIRNIYISGNPKFGTDITLIPTGINDKGNNVFRVEALYHGTIITSIWSLEKVNCTKWSKYPKLSIPLSEQKVTKSIIANIIRADIDKFFKASDITSFVVMGKEVLVVISQNSMVFSGIFSIKRI